MNELTVENIGEGIKEFIRYQAQLPDGPDLGSEVLVVGLVKDDALRRVLEVKGEIVIRIKGVPEVLVGIDANINGIEDLANYTPGMKRIKELARQCGARCTEAPLSVE